jgi:hypothetical protein
MAICIFITIGYLTIIFFDRLRRRKNKKSHEEYIADLETAFKGRESAIFDELSGYNLRLAEAVKVIEGIRPKDAVVNDSKRDLWLNLGSLFVGLGFLGLLSDRVDNEYLILFIRVVFALSVGAGFRFWFLYWKTRIPDYSSKDQEGF